MNKVIKAGWLIVDKPQGISSHTAVNKVSRLTRLKAGHAGTLDPMASGVLPIALGKATRLQDYAMSQNKAYIFNIMFGIATDSLDADGNITAQNEIYPKIDDINAILSNFIGKISQIPPQFSAIHINGKRAYQLAREGHNIEMPPREVVINNLEIRAVTEIGGQVRGLELYCDCSKGTYIRSLARDIANELGTIGHINMLRRVNSGIFHENMLISLENLQEIVHKGGLADVILPPCIVLDDISGLHIDDIAAAKIAKGQFLALGDYAITPANGEIKLMHNGELLAIARIKDDLIKPKIVF